MPFRPSPALAFDVARAGDFHFKHCARDFSHLRRFAEEQVRPYLRLLGVPHCVSLPAPGPLPTAGCPAVAGGGACRAVKVIGQPCAGKLHARLDKGLLARLRWAGPRAWPGSSTAGGLVRYRQMEGGGNRWARSNLVCDGT